MRLSLTALTTPTAIPLTTAEAKRHLGVTDSDHDLDIDTLIKAAMNYIERRSGRTLLTTSYRLDLPCFPDRIELPKTPLESLTSIDYYDVDGNDTPLANYQVWSSIDVPSYIVPAPSEVWPQTQAERIDAVRVVFDAGYGATEATVPPEAKHAIKLLIRHWYDNPSAVIVGSISKEVEFAADALIRSLGTGFYADV